VPKSDLPIGGDYAPVADRIALFYERFPAGRIITQLTMHNEREVVFRASVYRTEKSRTPAATGWASEKFGDGDVNTVACLENTETSAIGRALANLGFTASKNRPSLEEMEKAARVRTRLVLADRYQGASSDTLEDVLTLVRTAERYGLRTRRATWLRIRIRRGLFTPAQLTRLSRTLRRWVRADAVRAVESPQ
jgi:hypothetical protein